MLVKLKYLNGAQPGSSKEFTLDSIKIGRAADCDFALYDRTGRHSIASRVHAEIRRERDELFVCDLNSSNGTFVNGRRINKASLKNGDQIIFGPDGLKIQVNFFISSEDESEFLSSCPLFQGISQESLQAISRRGELKRYPAGSRLFHAGEICEALYVIYSGLVEVLSERDKKGRTGYLGFLSSGDSLGESLALIAGKHRVEARIADEAEIFKISAESLRELIRIDPDFALKFALALCQRLNASEDLLQARNSARKLQGDLDHFDLATVMQTLYSLRNTGLLALYPKTEPGSSIGGVKPYAQIYFEAGEARFAKFGSFIREEAVYQLFQMKQAGDFSFELDPLPEDMAAVEPIRISTMNLLLEALRRKDELESRKAEMPDTAITLMTRPT